MPGIYLSVKWFKKYYCWLFLLLTHPALAQKTKLDSLKQQLNQNMPDTARVKLLKKLSASAAPTTPAEKIYYANALMQLGEKIHDEQAVADAYINMAGPYSMRTKYDSALYYLSIGYNKAEKIKFAMGMGRSLVNMGYIYDRLDDQREAIKYYSQALDIFKKNKIQRGVDQCNNNIGSLYYDFSEFKIAESYFSECLKSYTKSNDKAGIASALYGVGNCAQSLGRDQEALEYFNQSMSIRQEMSNPNGIALTHRGLGIVYMHLKQYNTALEHLNAGLEIVKKLGDKYEETAILKIIVETYVAMKDYPKADKFAMENLKLSYSLKSKMMVLIALRELVTIHKNQNNLQKAFDFQSKYVATQDSVQAERTLKDITLVEISRMRNENADLSKNNQDISSKNTDYKERITHYSNVIVITSIVLGFVILLLLMLYHRNLEKQATNKILLEQKEEIANINHELETINEELTTQMELTNTQNTELERLNDIKNKFFSIISHDIRGPLVTLRSLFGVYRTGNITDDELRMLLAQLEETILSTSAFLDNLLEWSKSQLEGIVINPVDFNITGCIAENIHLFESQASMKGLKISNLATNAVMVHADQNMIRLVIRNLLSNSVKFCNPGDAITLNAEVKDGKALISVHDTGPGISDADREKLFSLEHVVSTGTQGEKGNHLGLILCRDMVLQNKGNIWLDTHGDEGTTFFIELPLAV